MSVEAREKAVRPPTRFRKWRWRLAVFAALLFALFFFTHREPSYMGKSIGRWFNDALGVESGSSQEVACLQAFLEMEGNALPFLIRRVDARVSSFDRLYARAMSHMPNGVWDALPSPRTEGYYANRLHSESKNEKNGMVFSLGLLGSNAAPFLPEIKRFAEDPGYAYPWTPKKLCDKYRLPLND